MIRRQRNIPLTAHITVADLLLVPTSNKVGHMLLLCNVARENESKFRRGLVDK